MNIISKIKGWISMLFKGKAKELFEVETITSNELENLINECAKVYSGNPKWLDADNGIKTINFAKAVCSETARLAMLGTKITIDGSARAEWLQKQIDDIYFKLRYWVEYGCAYGTVILKPNGKSIDLVTLGKFMVVKSENGKITGIVFVNQEEVGKKYYTRFEYHRFEDDGTYIISNKCYIGDSQNDINKSVDIKDTPWNMLQEEEAIANLEKPLYAVLTMPHANNIDIDSPLGLPIFYDALEELEDLDIAYSRNAEEIYDSARIVLLDSDRLLPSGGKVNNTIAGFDKARESMHLPKYVKSVYGNGREDLYQEINPQLNTDTRLSGINALLSQIGYKVGVSNGYFVFNESTGIQTATGVEAEQQRTIQFIKDVRDQIESCLTDLVYALNAFADLYALSPLGKYEITFGFGDITYNLEEDKATWWKYVSANMIPAWLYFVKFEGMSEDEAKEMVAEAKKGMENDVLFSEE